MSSPELTSDNMAFWQGRYQTQQTPWDLGQASPVLQHAVKEGSLSFLQNKANVVVVGCGTGHDAAWFAQVGHTVTGLDYTPEAVHMATEQYGKMASFVQADLFHLPEALQQQFDVVVEHTLFCAILPKQRPQYVQAVASLLKPKGYLLAVFYDHGEWGGPPYTTTASEVKALFEPSFQIHQLELSSHSVAKRQGQEWLGVLQKR